MQIADLGMMRELYQRLRLGRLKHITKPLPNGGFVLVLNTGAVIDAEAEAMLQALHSRSIGGIRSHLEILAQKGPSHFMEKFYVGFGHKSIGDCASVTIFIEGVSMLAAKAVQDSMLYSGQECSTRFMDFAKQLFLNPLETSAGSEILENWRQFYLDSMPKLHDYLTQQFPKSDSERTEVYKKAISARCFDILRAFLPAGTTTNLSWHTNLRQAADKLVLLRHHPLVEVQMIAKAIEDALRQAYPSSFSQKRHPGTEVYNTLWMEEEYYCCDKDCPDFALERDGIDKRELSRYQRFLAHCPPKTDLPKTIGMAGTLQFRFLLDFGSFRDLQRHRAVILRMPLLTTEHGFESWYLEQLPKDLKEKAIDLLANQIRLLQKLPAHPLTLQYYLPMGYRVPIHLTGDLTALVYLVELRGTRFVHPTLQRRALQIAKTLEELFGQFGLTPHVDEKVGRFDTKRGTQDIRLTTSE